MCGIFGAVGDDLTHESLRAMGARLVHRGPDDRGLETWDAEGVALGQTRLSIIDLSQAGRNPIPNEDGGVWVTCNGEIYNYLELRRELEASGHVFRSRTDTEVLVHAYEQWHDDHVARLRGMFAYALYDRRRAGGRRGRLLLVRDRLGIKPLYYYRDRRRFLFASEIGPLMEYPGVDTALDLPAIGDYLTYRYVPAPRTHVARIRKLEPGSLLALEPDRPPEVREYWSLAIRPRAEFGSPDRTAEALAAALPAMVERQLVSDVDVGVLLSGGIDSTAVAAFAAREHAGLSTFTLGFDVPGKREIAVAREVARHLGTSHHEGTATRESMDATLPGMPRLYGEPFADGSAIPTLEVCRLASRSVKVALSGDGGDELFGGYTHYRRSIRQRAWFGGIPGPIRRALFAAVAPGVRRGTRAARIAEALGREGAPAYGALLELFSPAEKRLLAGPALTPVLASSDDHWLFSRHWRTELDHLTRLQYVDLRTFLADDILTKVDRASMACSLEVRPVLLDHELVELAFAIPAHVRSGRLGLGGKHLLRRILRGRVPDAVLDQPKSGFGAPLDDWLHARRERLLADLAAGPLVSAGLISPDGLRVLAPRLAGLRLWSLVVLERCLADIDGPARASAAPQVTTSR